MSLQSVGVQRTFVRGFASATWAIGSLLFAAAFAEGADVFGPAATGYKTLNPPAAWVSKKREDLATTKPILENVKKIVGGAPVADFAGAFEKYFALVLFPQWTQTTEENLINLPKARDNFVRNYLEASAKNPTAHSLLVDVTHRELSKIAQDPAFHPAVRYNAILIVGLLNETEPNRGTGVKQMPEPYVKALSTLTDELKKPGNNEAVRVGALLGVSRHLEWDNAKAAAATKIQPAVRLDIINDLTGIVQTKTAPAGRSAEGQTWLRRRALEALGHAYADKVEGDFDKLLEGIIIDDAEPISVRCTAAEVMSRVDYKAPIVLPILPMAKNLGYLALFACHTELLRLERLKKKDEELIKINGGASGGGMMGGGMPGGGMPSGGSPGAPSGGSPGMPGGSGMGGVPGMPGMPGGSGMGGMPGMPGAGGRRGGGSQPGSGNKTAIFDPKAYRVDYSKRRLRAELYAVQLALGRKKGLTVEGLYVYAKAEPETTTLDNIRNQVEEVIKIVEELDQSAIDYEKGLRKEMKKLEALTRPLPIARIDAAKPGAAKGPAVPEEEVPMPAKPAAEDPMEEIPMGAPAKGPAAPAKGGAAPAGEPGTPAKGGAGKAPAEDPDGKLP